LHWEFRRVNDAAETRDQPADSGGTTQFQATIGEGGPGLPRFEVLTARGDVLFDRSKIAVASWTLARDEIARAEIDPQLHPSNSGKTDNNVPSMFTVSASKILLSASPDQAVTRSPESERAALTKQRDARQED
jgi:hypothetical protein